MGTAAHQRLAYFALRPQLFYDQIADVRPTNQTHPGATVVFYKYADLAAETTELTETVDPDAVAMSDSTVTVTVREYGNAIRTTAKARGTALLQVDSDAANIIGYNAGLSIDTIARTELIGGTNVIYAGTGNAATADVAAGDVITAANIRNAVAELRSANAMPIEGTYYALHLSPEQSVDLRSETGAGGWAEPANYSDASRRWAGMVGAFEGCYVMETPRVFSDTDGAASAEVFRATVTGKQALAKAHALGDGYGELPSIVLGPQVDKLRRFNAIGWKALLGYKRFREEAIQRIETTASI